MNMEMPKSNQGAEVVDLMQFAKDRLNDGTLSRKASAHAIEMLRNRGHRILTEGMNTSESSPVDFTLRGDAELVYYMLLIRDGAKLWNGEGATPTEELWVNTKNPKVAEALDIYRAFPSLIAKQPDQTMLDALPKVWSNATEAQRQVIVNTLIYAPDMQFWIAADGFFEKPAANHFRLLQADGPIFPYLPPEWQVEIEKIREEAKREQGAAPSLK